MVPRWALGALGAVPVIHWKDSFGPLLCELWASDPAQPRELRSETVQRGQEPASSEGCPARLVGRSSLVCAQVIPAELFSSTSGHLPPGTCML